MLSCLGLSAYFAFHAFYGRHGFEARAQLVERTSLIEFEIASLEAVRSKLVKDVALLRSDPPDPDLVEEVARDLLGFVHPADRLIILRSADR